MFKSSCIGGDGQGNREGEIRVEGGGEGQEEGEEGEWGEKLGKFLHVQASTAPEREEGEVRVWEGRGLPPVCPLI